MSNPLDKQPGHGHDSPFERIRRRNAAGHEFWSSREFAGVLNYADYRNFELVVQKAKTACFNSGHRLEDHFVDITEMVSIGNDARHLLKTVLMSRYAFLFGRGEESRLYLTLAPSDRLRRPQAVPQT